MMIMDIVEHRPPLKRIDFGLKPRAPEPQEAEQVKAARELTERLKYEALWRTIVRASQGQGSVEG